MRSTAHVPVQQGNQPPDTATTRSTSPFALIRDPWRNMGISSVNVLAFDIETVPDTDGGRRVYGLKGLSDAEVAQIMFTKRREQTDSEFLPAHFQKIVTISAVLRKDGNFKAWSLGTPDSTEAELVTRFFDGVARYTPTLVSWNGGGFDLPVLHYRALINGIAAPRYWDVGDDDRDFRWNNYLNRFHYRHTDMMDVLSGYQARQFASLDQVALLLGLPGKMGQSGANVWEQYQAGGVEQIRNYCETDALNTYLVYLRWELIRGNLTLQNWEHECDRIRDELREENKAHWNEFLLKWQ
jgi:predicted PolB exonuclease-like 3'-5' exonuclease